MSCKRQRLSLSRAILFLLLFRSHIAKIEFSGDFDFVCGGGARIAKDGPGSSACERPGATGHPRAICVCVRADQCGGEGGTCNVLGMSVGARHSTLLALLSSRKRVWGPGAGRTRRVQLLIHSDPYKCASNAYAVSLCSRHLPFFNASTRRSI